MTRAGTPVEGGNHDRRFTSQGSCSVRSAAFIESLEFRRLLNAAIVVNTTDDETIVNSTTSLREAITIAETNAGDDTITFDPTVFTSGSLHTILLNSTLELTGANGKLDIDGPGSGILAVSGNDANRVFTVDAPFVGSINNMTISHGRVNGGGGGINNLGSLTLDTDSFESNKALGTTGADGDATTPGGNGTDALGGAIDNHDQLDVEGCTFDSNEVLGGGGGSSPDGAGNGGNAKGAAIYTSGPLTVATSSFENDQAIGGVEGQTVGGDNLGVSGEAAGADIGIGVLIPIVNISTSTFANSVATGGQGNDANGAFVAGTGGDAEGGSIYSDTPNFTLKNCTFNAAQGAGRAQAAAIAASAPAARAATLRAGRFIWTASPTSKGVASRVARRSAAQAAADRFPARPAMVPAARYSTKGPPSP